MQWIYWLIAIFGSLGAGYWVYKADKRRGSPYPLVTALLRTVVVMLALLLLLAPVFTITKNETQKPVVLFLQDGSRSIAAALGNDSPTYRTDAEQLIKKLSDKYKVVSWNFSGDVHTDSTYTYKGQATDIAASLVHAQDFFNGQNLGAVIMATDGRFNQGANPLYQQLNLQGSLYTVAIGDSTTQKDIRITAAYANRTVTLNSTFEVRADVVAAMCSGYSNSIQLMEGGNVISTTSVSVATDRYDRTISFSVKAAKSGIHHYVIAAPAADGEKNIANNRRDIFVEVVDEQKKILIATVAPHPDVNAIREALEGLETYKVTVANADALPSLNDYSVVICNQLPATGSNAMRQLQSFKKPVWYIIGSRSDINTLNEQQQAVGLRMNPGMLRDMQPAYNPAFNLFTLPQNIQAVMDRMPPLSVPMGDIQIAPNATVLLSQRQGSAPLWVMQQGNAPVAMLLGEGLWRWRLYEYKNFGKHDVIDECIRQTIAFLSANSNDRPFKVAMPKYIWSDQEAISLNAYLLNANNEQVNTPDAQITITDSAGRKQNFTFERSGSAYKLNIGVWAGGTYNYTAHTVYNGVTHTSTGSFVVENIPVELMEPGADYPLLYSLSKKYNGTLVSRKNISALYDSIIHNESIKPVIQTTTEAVPLISWRWYFLVILLAATTEWLLRKYWMAQ